MSLPNFIAAADSLRSKLLNSAANKLPAQQNHQALQARAINILNIFRFILGLLFIFTFLYLSKESLWGKEYSSLFFNTSLSYLLFSIIVLLASQLKSTSHPLALPLQVVVDIFFIILLMFAAGGIQSGLGLLLIIIIVIASLVSNGRLALFYAAVASIGLLLEQSYRIVMLDLAGSAYTQAVMLSLSCFATAVMAYHLVKRMQRSEDLASARGIDLENLEQVNALITQEMQDGVIVVDKYLNIRHHNAHAESQLAIPKHNNETFSLFKCAPKIAATLSGWIKGEDANNNAIISVGNQELKLRFMPINQQPASLNEAPYLNRNAGAVIFIQDWSQIQAVAQQTKLAALGRLTVNIAHEIRNPLSAISHANQLLQEEECSGTTKRILQIVEDNIQRIDQIIKDVLELNRRDRTQQEQIDLSRFLPEFHGHFCAVEKLAVSDFKIETSLPKQMIEFDQRHLTQILWNLCKNGWEHSRKNSKSLSLRCVAVGNTGLNIEIVDDGPGVAEKDRAKLFEPFYTTKPTGNGLGLYISRELAEANGANLQYQALPSGCAFVIQLKKNN